MRGGSEMLEAALKVIDSARSLRLVQKGGRTRSELPDLDLARAIEALRQAVETFDRETGTETSGKAPAPVARPDFAVPPQLDDDGFVIREAMLERVRGGQAAVLVHPDGLLPDPEPAAPNQEPEPQVSLPAPAPLPPMAPERTPGHDLGGEGLFFDGDESAADLLQSMNAIDAKLAFAVSKVGWSPRLRALAAAQRIAHANMFIEVDGPGGWVRIPARNWGTLTLAIAEAALDQDLSLALPAPRPKEPGHEYEPPVPRPYRA